VILNATDELRLRANTAIQAIRSRHVAHLYDVVESKKGVIGLVQEFVPGSDVGAWAANKDGADGSEHCLIVLYQIACGLSDIHASGKIHCDIKPRN
jgi:serine/threonine protein kinase